MKRITMMEFRRSPGGIISDVFRHGAEFLIVRRSAIAKKDTPMAMLVPVREYTVILSDGSIIGPKPLTLGEELDGSY